jgi:hypothetical protein
VLAIMDRVITNASSTVNLLFIFFPPNLNAER